MYAVACLAVGLTLFFLGVRLVANTGRGGPKRTLGLGFAMMIAGLGLVVTTYAFI